ncbi:uncharacterized protein I-3 [Drosophila bipectinata]|uniref:uncharacterized protein I-3 n=1 Tax=Drosophila bipectinata TaxID=42026 RepID=UPI001C8A54A0|nr:type 1 phosphatases regulator ypi1 [Drosophila bipectinata]
MDQSKAKVSSVEKAAETSGRTIRIEASANIQGSPSSSSHMGKVSRPASDSGFSSAESTDSVKGSFSTSVSGSAPTVLRLRLSHAHSPPRASTSTSTSTSPPERHVGFHEGVIDNEHMNKRKSKCCCIYRKPHPFGESSSSTEDECEHCFGHPEVRQRNRLEKQKKRRQQCSGDCDCCCCCGGRQHTQDTVKDTVKDKESKTQAVWEEQVHKD